MPRRVSASLLDHAKAVQAALKEQRRAARRSLPVPFVPKPPPPGWLNLESDIAEMFHDLGVRDEAVEEALWRLALWLRRNGLSTPRVQELRRRRRLAGICRECPEPAVPGKRSCQLHVDAARERAKRRKDAAIAGGRCTVCSKPAVKRGRKCAEHRRRSQEGTRARREEQTSAGLCAHGRCPEQATRGKYCQEHASKNCARSARWRREGAKAGWCRACTDQATHGVFCQAHAEDNRERARSRRGAP